MTETGIGDEQCDFHTHLNYSKDCSLSIDSYLRILYNAIMKRGIRVSGVSITDHNTISAYTSGRAGERIRELNDNLPLERRVKFIMGVELSLDVGENEKRQHVHFLFYYPARSDEMADAARRLEEGALGGIIKRIVSQNNERHQRMAVSACQRQGLSVPETEALLSMIEGEKGPSPEIGREHLKNAFKILFEIDEYNIRRMFSRPKAGISSCHVPLSHVRSGVPYREALKELRSSYPLATIALAHPWRYDTGFYYADPEKRRDGVLIDMSRFIPSLVEDGLINGLEIAGNFKIPSSLIGRQREELVRMGLPSILLNRIRARQHFCKYTGDTYEKMAEKYKLICVAGNDSHGQEKPGIPIGFGCKRTDPLPYSRTGIRMTPAKGSPIITLEI